MIHKLLISAVSVIAILSGCAPTDRNSFRDGFAPVSDGQLYYQVAGAGDAVVLVHGNAGDHRHWNNQFEQLASEFTVIRYDVRGWGRSSDPIIGSSYSDFSDLAALMNYLDVESAHIVGWSMGSGIAFDFVTAYPDRAESLVSVGPWVFGHQSKAINKLYEQAGAVVKAASEGGAEAGANAFVDYVLNGTAIEDSADQFMRTIGSESSFWTFTNPSQSVSLDPSAASQLSKLTIPILVVTAEHDLTACHDMADFIISEAQNARRLDMVETGHLMHIEKPKEFNARLLEFLKDPH